jgi:ubiquitin-protein ligase
MMTSPRLRRLKLDYERLTTRFQGWPLIKITGAVGSPVEHYQVTFFVRGLYATPQGQILERDQHVAEINLSLGYPRRAPQCKMVTPIFHPNFDQTSICIGDFWAASEGLDDLIVRIGRMVAYQEFNTKSPLNGLAAKWAAEHARDLPVDARELAPPSLIAETKSEQKLVVTLASAPDAHVRIQTPPALTEAKKPEPVTVHLRASPRQPTAAPAGSENLHSPDQQLAETQALKPSPPRSLPRLRFGAIGVELRGNSTSIGRRQDNAIEILDESVSGLHAVVTEDAGWFMIRDLGSTNGTKINGSKIAESTLKDGDRVTFGKIEAVFIL